MKKNQVRIGGTYTAKVSGFVVPVRILNESPRGDWVGINILTKREVRIKTAARLRREIDPHITNPQTNS